MLRSILEDAGYEVEEAPHGKAALELLKNGSQLPDVLTTDLMMPVMGGNELIHRLRSEPMTASIPIVVVSANATFAEGVEASERADALMGKPFVAASLVKLIQSVEVGVAPGGKRT